jgi:hypothetical protein
VLTPDYLPFAAPCIYNNCPSITATANGDLFDLGVDLYATGAAHVVALTHNKLLWQLAVFAPVLLLVSAGFGPALRDLQVIHIAGLLFQSTAVA